TALSAGAGIALALWVHDGRTVDLPSSADPATSIAASVGAPGPSAADAAARSTSRQHLPTDAPDDAPPGLARPPAEPAQRLAADPKSALDALLRLPPPQRAMLSDQLIRTAAARAPDATLAWLRDHTNVGELEPWLAAYAGIAATDPIFALNEVLALPEGEIRQYGLQRVLEVWARHDPVAAYEWVRSSTGADAIDLHVAVMDGYIEALPQQAGELIAAMPDGATRARLIDRYAYLRAESNPRAAADWLARFGDAAPAQQALSTVYDQWAQQDPWAAIEHAAQNVDGELGVELVGQVAATLALARPDELARSLERFPEAYRAVAVERLASA